MGYTPESSPFKVGTIDGKRFVGYKIVRENAFDSALYGLYQSKYKYPDGFIQGMTLTVGGNPEICYNGWHAWRHLRVTRDEIKGLLDAGYLVRLFAVEIWGGVKVKPEKFVGAHMRVLYEIPINEGAKRLLSSRMMTRAWNRYLAKRKGTSDV